MAMPSQITNDDHIVHRVVPTQEVRQGETSGHVRMILSTSLALAVVAGVALYVLYF
jgi:hypothetical protein